MCFREKKLLHTLSFCLLYLIFFVFSTLLYKNFPAPPLEFLHISSYYVGRASGFAKLLLLRFFWRRENSKSWPVKDLDSRLSPLFFHFSNFLPNLFPDVRFFKLILIYQIIIISESWKFSELWKKKKMFLYLGLRCYELWFFLSSIAGLASCSK